VKPITWVWPGWLAAGQLQLLAGQAGTGKTTLAIAMAATITTGGRWPDGATAPIGDVVIWSGEDGAAETLVPRFVANGGDRRRFHIVTAARDAAGRQRRFDPATDMPQLADAVSALPALKLVIFDPVVSAVTGDSHKNTEVRRGLQSVVDFAAYTGAAVLGITHYSKSTAGRDPLERVTGSLAFGAVARVVLGTVKPIDSSQPRRLVRTKSNIGSDGAGFEYRLESVKVAPGIWNQRVNWGAALEGSARALMAEIEDPLVADKPAKVDTAAKWLTSILADGPVAANDIYDRGTADGFARATVMRAKVAAGVVVAKSGFNGGWMWSLPPKMLKHAEDAHSKTMSTFEDFEHLRGDDFEGEA
jgi:hypothetical protein